MIANFIVIYVPKGPYDVIGSPQGLIIPLRTDTNVYDRHNRAVDYICRSFSLLWFQVHIISIEIQKA